MNSTQIKTLKNLTTSMKALAADMNETLSLRANGQPAPSDQHIKDHDVHHPPQHGDTMLAATLPRWKHQVKRKIPLPHSTAKNAYRVELLASLGQSFDYQPLVTLHNLPGLDAEFTPEKLRAFAAAFTFFAEEAEKHAASQDANRIAQRTFTCTIA